MGVDPYVDFNCFIARADLDRGVLNALSTLVSVQTHARLGASCVIFPFNKYLRLFKLRAMGQLII